MEGRKLPLIPPSNSFEDLRVRIIDHRELIYWSFLLSRKFYPNFQEIIPHLLLN